MANIENIFAECVNDIQSGAANVEECLAAHPEHAGELAPMLGLHGAVAGIGQASLSPAADAAILSAMAAKAGSGPPPSSGGGWSGFWPWTLVLMVMLALVAVAAAVTMSGEDENGPASAFQSGGEAAESSASDNADSAESSAGEESDIPAEAPVATGGTGASNFMAAATAPGSSQNTPQAPPATPSPPAMPPEPGPEDPEPGVDAPLVINEILFNQSGGADTEWIELFAGTSDPLDVSGWSLTNQDGFVFTFPIFTADPGSYLIVHTGMNSSNNTDPVHNGDEHHFYAGEASHQWNNVADDVLLLDSDSSVQTTLADGTVINGRPVDYVTYGSSSGGERDAPPVASDSTTVAFDGSAPEISGPDQGTSVSLAPNGTDTDSGSDWVESGDGGTSGPSSEGTTNTP